MTTRTVSVYLKAQIADYTQKMGQAGKATSGLSDEIAKTTQKSKLNMEQLGHGMTIVGVALAGVATAAVLAAAKFDKQMSEVGAVADATAGQMDDLRTAAIKAGAATVFSASEAAQAEAELAKAGVKTSDILGGALDGSLALASAGQIDLAQSATIAAAAMNTFGLAGRDVTHIADVLAAGANKSAAGVDDLGQGLQQVGLVAAQAGLSLEETVGVLAAMADRGLKGSDGATSLKTALQRLTAPTGDAQAAMDKLGISFYDANGQMVHIDEIAGQLRTSLDKLAPAQKNAALQTIFGSDAIRAANVLYGLGKTGVDEYVTAVDQQGAAADVAAKKLDNLSGDVEQLKGSLETLFIGAGEGSNSALRPLLQDLTKMVNAVAGLPAPVLTAGVAIAGLTGLGLLGASAIIKLSSGLGKFSAILAETNPRLAAFGTRLERIGRVGATAGLGLVAVAGALGLIVSQLQGGPLVPQMEALDKAMEDFAKTGKLSGEGLRVVGDSAGDLQRALAGVANTGLAHGLDEISNALIKIGTLGMASSPLDQSREKINALDSALAELVSGGHADAAAQAWGRLVEQAREQGLSIDRLREAFPQYAAAASGASTANTVLTDTVTAQMKAIDQTIDSWKAYNNVLLTSDSTLLAAEQSIDGVTDAFKKGSKSVTGNSRAALENRTALEKAAEAAQEAATQYLKNGGTIEGATKLLDGFKQKAEDATGATKGNKKAVDDFAASLFALPKDVQVNIDANIRIATIQANTAKGIQSKLNRLGMAEGGVVEHAASGLLSQAGVHSGGPLYAFAEPKTGGEAFVPRHGDYVRSMGILGHAAGWYGASVVPQPYRGPAAQQAPQVVITPVVGGSDKTVIRAVMEGVRYEVRTGYGGSVQTAMGPRR